MSGSRGVPYFYNSETKTSVWETPDGLTREDIQKLPGAEYLTRPAKVKASHLLVKHSGSRNPSSWREVRCDFQSIFLSLTTSAPRIKSRVQRPKRLRSSKDTKPRSTDPTRSSHNSQKSSQTAALLARAGILVFLVQDRCRSRSKMPPSP